MRAPIAIALDVPTLSRAVELTDLLGAEVAMVKVGLQSYLRDGNDGVRQIQEKLHGSQLFLDLKLHDIPQTVAGAISSIKSLKPNVLTVHASGGPEMLKAAVIEAEEIDIAAVTILTSMSQDDVSVISEQKISDLVLRLAEVSVKAGCRAIVCSPHEVATLRRTFGDEIKLIVPGVRMPGEAAGDQTRIATPAETIKSGATYVVMGRSLTNESDPVNKLKLIRNSLVGVV
ncbi:MAG: orotidine-5'-phosphate decarboxylase [Candidatus Nanopelagicales bacterium]|jgi:orotidine-5'-phosphate decarboxylase